MKRIFTFVLSALLAVTFTTASAQRNIFVWKNGGNLVVKSTTNVDSLTFEERPTMSTYTLINGHEFIDLGLPSGLLWAKTNVGASSSFDDGDHFAWGETETKSSYSWYTYKWGRYSSSLSKYNSKDGKTTLDAEDDAATVNWGEGCRMPSRVEFQELYNKCDWYWKSNYNETGVSGYLVTGPNGNTIFFPASGFRSYDSFLDHGSDGDYWSSTLNSSGTEIAYFLKFYGGNITPSDESNRYQGYSVRPVAEK